MTAASNWIGTGGYSPFGAYGYYPGGIRAGGEGWMQSAVKVAEERRFRNYRNDLILDVRQTKMALKKLRQLRREGAEEELDIDLTIDKTAKEGGEIELVFSRSRENTIRLLLLMDSGGSMAPYTNLVRTALLRGHAVGALQGPATLLLSQLHLSGPLLRTSGTSKAVPTDRAHLQPPLQLQGDHRG